MLCWKYVGLHIFIINMMVQHIPFNKALKAVKIKNFIK